MRMGVDDIIEQLLVRFGYFYKKIYWNFKFNFTHPKSDLMSKRRITPFSVDMNNSSYMNIRDGPFSNGGVGPSISAIRRGLGLADESSEDDPNVSDAETVIVEPSTEMQYAPTVIIPDMDYSDEELDDRHVYLRAKPMKRKATEHVARVDRPVMKGQGAKRQRYCFTWNNPTMEGDELVSLMDGKDDIELAVFQKEVGANGVPHFQGYMETKKRMYTTGVQSMMAPVKMSLLHCKGTKQQNHVYCTKEESRTEGPWYVKSSADDYTRKNGKQGQRTDLDDYAKLILDEGGITEKVIEEMPGHVVRFGKHGEDLIGRVKLMKAKADEKDYWREQWQRMQAGLEIEGQKQRHLELFFGPTAVGKTTMVKLRVIGELEQDLFEKDASSKWWGGYEGEKHVLLDEYKGGQTIDQFKAMTNVGVVPIEGKGTELVLLAESMYFTSNRHPSEWWKRNEDEYENWNSPDYKAMVRRFAKVYWWNDAKELKVLENPGKQEDTPEWKKKWAEWQNFWEWRSAPARMNDRVNGYFTL